MYKVDLANKRLIPLTQASLSTRNITERYDLQEWIEATPAILGEPLLIIGKELPVSSGARLDLLAVDRAGCLVVVELKRDDSGSNVEWQAIRYASYCASLLRKDILGIYADYLRSDEDEAGRRIGEFVTDEDPSVLNERQRIILCARRFHSDAVSAVLWLRDYGVDVSCLRLEPYWDQEGQLFLNPDIIIPLPEAKDYVEKRERKEKESQQREPWTGIWFVNVGEGTHRTWEDNRGYGYIGAGQGRWASSGLERLSVGDRIVAYVKGAGYVGFGRVTKASVPISQFVVEKEGKSLLDLPMKAQRAAENKDSPELCEYCVGVDWLQAYDLEHAKTFRGIFANQNIACKLRHRETYEFLKQHFNLD